MGIGGGAGDGLACTIGHPGEAALKRPLGMGELGQPPHRSQALTRAHDPVEQHLMPKARRNRVQVGARMARARGKRAREALA